MPKNKKLAFLSKTQSREQYLFLTLIATATVVVFFWVAFPNLFTKASDELDNLADSSQTTTSVVQEVTQDDLEKLLKELKSLESRIIELEKKKFQKPPEQIETVVPVSQNIYIVQPRDYLFKIAQSVYGDGNKWYDLVNLNRNIYPEIANPPYLLNIGWELRY